MARKQLFYTNEQIIENLYTPGGEYQLQDETIYIGLYHRYTTGEVYTEGKWNEKTSKVLTIFKSEPLIVKQYKKNKQYIKTKFKSPIKYIPVITSQDIQQKYITRYFLYKINERQIIEIDKVQFDLFNSSELDNNLYYAITINWSIVGNPYDTIQGNIKKIGVINKNQTTIIRTNQIYPGFSEVINNPLELYVDTTVIVPPDIN